MKILSAVTLSLLVAVALGCGKPYEATGQGGEYVVTLKMDKSSPMVGDNHLTIEVTDAAGNSVTDAAVKVNYSMPAMPGMPPMNYEADATSSGKAYTTLMNLSMAGPWNIAVKVSRGDTTDTVNFSVDAR